MAKQPHWFDQSYAADAFGNLLSAVIEVTRPPKKPDPPKPAPHDKKRVNT